MDRSTGCETEEPISEPQSEKSSMDPELTVEEAHIQEVSAKSKSYEHSMELKKSGNHKFGEGEYEGALDDYSAALDLWPDTPEHNKDKSIVYSNRAAAFLKLEIKENYETAISDCTAALELDPDNMKALLRRAQLHEHVENLESALADYQVLWERNPAAAVKAAIARLPKQIEEKNEKMKTEMIDKLKDLGNLVLKPFGLSTDNFKMEPQASGGYSVKFEPSKKK